MWTKPEAVEMRYGFEVTMYGTDNCSEHTKNPLRWVFS